MATIKELVEGYAERLKGIKQPDRRIIELDIIRLEVEKLRYENNPLSEEMKARIFRQLKEALLKKGFTLPDVINLESHSGIEKAGTQISNDEILELMAILAYKLK